ncbi:hypothetical protein BC830DRAFT_223276 [Chytriomyces sp. MP71]|nr:hypothetical protein BC830DRAFT_223276 [Chytriomyces sp. MP71]
MLEALPKLLILKELLLDKPEYADVKIMVPEKGIAGCIDSTLSMSEFDSIRDRFILYKYPGSTRYHFKKGLHLVDWMHAQDDVHETLSKNLWSAYWPPREIHHNLRAFFYKALMARNKMPVVHVDDTDGAIVYVSRINSVRGFPNELELLDYLKGRFGDRFQIHTGQEAQLDQVAMFARARVVVGTHGAGLANYVFAQPGAALVFVPMDPLIEFCFGHIVAAMGGSHYLITEIPGSHYHGTYGKITEEQMQLMGDTIQIALDKILAQTLSHHDEL